MNKFFTTFENILNLENEFYENEFAENNNAQLLNMLNFINNQQKKKKAQIVNYVPPPQQEQGVQVQPQLLQQQGVQTPQLQQPIAQSLQTPQLQQPIAQSLQTPQLQQPITQTIQQPLQAQPTYCKQQNVGEEIPNNYKNLGSYKNSNNNLIHIQNLYLNGGPELSKKNVQQQATQYVENYIPATLYQQKNTQRQLLPQQQVLVVENGTNYDDKDINDVINAMLKIPIIPSQSHRIIKIRLYTLIDLLHPYKKHNILDISYFEQLVLTKWSMYNQNYTQIISKQHYNENVFQHVISFTKEVPHKSFNLQIFVIYQIINYITINHPNPLHDMYLIQLRFGFLISNFEQLYLYAYHIKLILLKNEATSNVKILNYEQLIQNKIFYLPHCNHDYNRLYNSTQQLNTYGMNLYNEINTVVNYKITIVFNIHIYNFINKCLDQ